MTLRTNSKIATAGLLALSVAAIGATAARADSHMSGETAEAVVVAQEFAAAKTTLAQAITAAEAQGGGKVASIEFSPADAAASEPAGYDVTVLMADGTMTELVDAAAAGTVMADVEEADSAEGDEAGEGEGEEGGEENEG